MQSAGLLSGDGTQHAIFRRYFIIQAAGAALAPTEAGRRIVSRRTDQPGQRVAEFAEPFPRTLVNDVQVKLPPPGR